MRISDWSSDVCSSDLRLERQRDEGGNTIAGILASVGLPARRVSAHSIVGALKTFAHQQVMDPRHPQPLAPAAHLVLFQQRIEPSRSEEHTSELQSLMRNSYAVFCLKKKTNTKNTERHNVTILLLHI